LIRCWRGDLRVPAGPGRADPPAELRFKHRLMMGPQGVRFESVGGGLVGVQQLPNLVGVQQLPAIAMNRLEVVWWVSSNCPYQLHPDWSVQFGVEQSHLVV